jgi:hypothetical protein
MKGDTMANYEMTREAWMRYQQRLRAASDGRWHWPLSLSGYDQRPDLDALERAELATLVGHIEGGHRNLVYQLIRAAMLTSTALTRLVAPLCDVLDATGALGQPRQMTLRLLLQETHRRKLAHWGWERPDWLALLGTDAELFWKRHHVVRECRQQVIAVCYLLTGCTDFRPCWVNHQRLATTIFGKASVEKAILRVEDALHAPGGHEFPQLPGLLSQVLLANRSPLLEDLTFGGLDELYRTGVNATSRPQLSRISQALVSLGMLEKPIGESEYLHSEWVTWCRRWRDTSQLTERVRQEYYPELLRAGRWLAQAYPGVQSPAQWDRSIAQAYMEALDQMVERQWTSLEGHAQKEAGKGSAPLSPIHKWRQVRALRTFFRDCQRWGWLTLDFDPRTSFVLASMQASGFYRRSSSLLPYVHPGWAGWCERWREASSLPDLTRDTYYSFLLGVGCWLAGAHPEVHTPEQWTEQVAADYVAALSRSVKGSSKPLKSSTQKQYLLTLRAFFRECQRQFGLIYAFEPGQHLRL